MGIKVLIADEYDIVRIGISALLESHPDIDLVGNAHTGLEVLEQLREGLPVDVIILDISAPRMSSVEIASEIQKQRYDCRVVALCEPANESQLWRALQAGALACVSKDSMSKDLVEAIRAVHAGWHYFSSKLLALLVKGYLRDSSFARNPFARLTIERNRSWDSNWKGNRIPKSHRCLLSRRGAFRCIFDGQW